MSCCDAGLEKLPLSERKKILRKKAKTVLKELFSDSALANQLSITVCDYFTKSSIYKDAPAIFAYMAMSDEIDLSPVMQKALKDGKKLYLPRMKASGNEMDFYQVKDLESSFTSDNIYKIKEPAETCPVIDSSEIPAYSAFLIPGLAFNLNGARLGRGKGYYDRYLSSLDVKGKNLSLSGVCSVNLITKDIPTSDNDFFVTHLLNEYAFIECKQ